MEAGGFGFSRPNNNDLHARYELNKYGIEGLEAVRYQHVSDPYRFYVTNLSLIS